MRWVSYVHPALMPIVLALGVLVFREGLALRRHRLLGRSPDTSRHRRLGRTFLSVMALGYAAGVVSLGLLRGEPILESFHSLCASAAAACVTAAWLVGRRLERRPDPRLRTAHAVCGSVGLLMALVAGAAGLAILP